MANPIPNMPLRVPMTDANGLISTPWMAFIRELFNRVGGTQAVSNATLASDIAALKTRATALESEFSGLGQGRAL